MDNKLMTTLITEFKYFTFKWNYNEIPIKLVLEPLSLLICFAIQLNLYIS